MLPDDGEPTAHGSDSEQPGAAAAVCDDEAGPGLDMINLAQDCADLVSTEITDDELDALDDLLDLASDAEEAGNGLG